LILYCDSSALVKRYLKEEGSDAFDRFWDDYSEIATSVVAYAECLAAFNRRLREKDINREDHELLSRQFKGEYYQLLLVPISEATNEIADKLIGKYPLRGFDAIHLSSALLIQQIGKIEVVFAAFDKTLNQAAKEENLKVPFFSF